MPVVDEHRVKRALDLIISTDERAFTESPNQISSADDRIYTSAGWCTNDVSVTPETMYCDASITFDQARIYTVTLFSHCYLTMKLATTLKRMLNIILNSHFEMEI